jgi:hypothetical protein
MPINYKLFVVATSPNQGYQPVGKPIRITDIKTGLKAKKTQPQATRKSPRFKKTV